MPRVNLKACFEQFEPKEKDEILWVNQDWVLRQLESLRKDFDKFRKNSSLEFKEKQQLVNEREMLAFDLCEEKLRETINKIRNPNK